MSDIMDNGNQPRQFTDEQRTFCILKFESYGPGKGRYSSYPRIKKEFEEKFPGVSAPTQEGIRKMSRKLKTTFTVKNLNSEKSGRKRTVRTPENIESVRVATAADLTKGIFDPSVSTGPRNDLNISASSFCRILKLDLK